MKVVVIGGTGLIGSKLVAKLTEHGHDPVAASPASGVNTITGEGLDAVLRGADAVVDVSNSPSWDDDAVMEFFRTATGNLLAAERSAGVGHHVALSVVGTDRMQASGYFRAKLAQEQLIEAGPIPYSIVRATQFFEFVQSIADTATDGDVVRLAPAPFQPMAADDVAAAIGRTTAGGPVQGIVEVGGPERFQLDELVRMALARRGDPRQVVTDPGALYYGWVPLADDTLVPADGAQLGSIRFGDWLDAQAPATV